MGIVQIEIDECLLQLDFPWSIPAREGVFEFQLRTEPDPVTETIAEVENEPVEVDLFLVRRSAFPRQVTLTRLAQPGLISQYVMKSQEIIVVKTPPVTPQCNAFAERHSREIRETLDDMILLSERHLHYVLKRIEKHHNDSRHHQGLGNVIPMDYECPEAPAAPGEVSCESQLGGLLNHYYLKKTA